MGQERHLIRCREVQKSRCPSGWGRRDFQSGNSGDEGPEMGVHAESLVKSKGAGKAGTMIRSDRQQSLHQTGPWSHGNNTDLYS